MASDLGTDDTVALTDVVAATRAPSSRLHAGQVVERYLVEGLLGAGGMAEVYRAKDQRLGRAVALKLVRPVQEGEACGSLCSLLMREARTLATLSNPSILTVHDVGEHEGCVYLAMELIDGATLREWASGVSDWRERLRFLLDAGTALAAAHAARVVHRDVKPDNILVARSGRVVVSDFGVARSLADLDDQGHQCGCAGGATVRVDLEGKVVGTPHYMSPEQHQGLMADARSDQFSFAVTCWETLHRALPFVGADMASIREEVLATRIQPVPPASDVPEPVSAALRRGMKPSASARYPSMEAFVETLARAAG
jgi:serine/threonine protein kinase